MASATKQKPKQKQKPSGAKRRPARPGKRPAAPAPDAEIEVDGPDRSAPPLAEVDAEVLEFIDALDRFKKQHGRPFPSWSEVLMVVRQLGYRRG